MKEKGMSLILFGLVVSIGIQTGILYFWYLGLLIAFIGLMIVFLKSKGE